MNAADRMPVFCPGAERPAVDQVVRLQQSVDTDFRDQGLPRIGEGDRDVARQQLGYDLIAADRATSFNVFTY